MELHKVKSSNVKDLDLRTLREMERDIRKGLLDLRMSIFTTKSAHGAKIRGLRKSLARVLTAQSKISSSHTVATSSTTKKSM